MQVHTLPIRPGTEAGSGFANDHTADVYEIDFGPQVDISTDTTRIAGATVEYTEIKPLDEDRLVEPTPLVMVGGYLSTSDTNKELSVCLARKGRHVFNPHSAHAQSIAGLLDPANLLGPEQLTSKSAYAAIRAVLRRGPHDQVDIVVHSMMGPMILPTVERRLAGRVRSLVLIDPIDNLGLWGVARGTAQCVKEEVAPNWREIISISGDPKRLALDSLYYLFRNVPQTLAELNFIRTAQIRTGLRRLGAQSVRVGLLVHQDDPYVPGGDCLQKLNSLVDAATCVDGGHTQLQRDPKGSAEAITNLLARLNDT